MQDTEMQDTDWASRDWTYGKILRDKTIVVTGCSSGIGRDTAKLIKQLGGDVIGVDRNKTEDYVDELYLADLSDRRTIKALVHALPGRIDGIANIAGLPPTAPADLVVKVNLVGLKYFTELMVPKLNDNASIVNLASLAGFGWPDALEAIKASEHLAFEDVERFMHDHKISNEGGRSYFFSKEALVVWTKKNRWTWRDRGIHEVHPWSAAPQPSAGYRPACPQSDHAACRPRMCGGRVHDVVRAEDDHHVGFREVRIDLVHFQDDVVGNLGFGKKHVHVAR